MYGLVKVKINHLYTLIKSIIKIDRYIISKIEIIYVLSLKG